MSPNFEKAQVLQVARVKEAPSLSSTPPKHQTHRNWKTDGATTDEYEDVDWKLQRKLKHQQRDHGKHRHAGHVHPGGMHSGTPPKPRYKQHSHHHQHRPLQELRLEKEAWLASDNEDRTGRTIPLGHREQSVATRAMPMSRSVPSAVSWPPSSGVSNSVSDENVDPNYNGDELSSSAPGASSYMKRSYASKREIRPITIFESALIFNESGCLLSHDNFDELGSSPDLPAHMKRKAKRRVGRRKSELKRSELNDILKPDDIILELMAFLLPHVEVAKELNLLLLGSQQNGDVFHFDEDEFVDQVPSDSTSAVKSTPLEVDMLKFQTSLTRMLFGTNAQTDIETLHHGTSGEELADLYITERWIAQTVLATVKLDLLVQYECFAVLQAIFRVMPNRRRCILEAIASASLAVFLHQGMNNLAAIPVTPEYVTMKGLIAFLNSALSTIQQDTIYAPDVFGTNTEDVDTCVGDLCNQISHALKLLIRSSPGKSRRQDENNSQLEKFNEGSDSVEATTYGAIGDVLYRLAVFSPRHGEEFLRWMLLKWPQRNVQQQLFFVRFMGGLLVQFMNHGLFFSHDVVDRTFSRLRECICSSHFLIAKEACGICSNLDLMEVFLSRDQVLREKMASALHESATSHWNKRIRQQSDECFDMLLDFA